MLDGSGTTTYGFDELGSPTSVASPGPKTVGYRYDLDGNRAKLIYPDSTAVNYAYDKAGRLASLTDWASRTTGFSYYDCWVDDARLVVLNARSAASRGAHIMTRTRVTRSLGKELPAMLPKAGDFSGVSSRVP